MYRHSKAYTIVMTLMLASVGIKYEGSNTNPFQQSTPTTLLFIAAVLWHAVASMADITLQTTIIIVHVSGVLACEALLWILVVEFWWWCIINVLVLPEASFCFFHCIGKYITQLLHATGLKADHMQKMEPQEAQVLKELP